MVAHRPLVNDVFYRQLCRVSSVALVAVTTISLIVHFLLVIDITAGSTDHCADRGALPATEQRATNCSNARSNRRAPDRFASCVLAVVIVVIIIATVAITSEI